MSSIKIYLATFSLSLANSASIDMKDPFLKWEMIGLLQLEGSMAKISGSVSTLGHSKYSIKTLTTLRRSKRSNLDNSSARVFFFSGNLLYYDVLKIPILA